MYRELNPEADWLTHVARTVGDVYVLHEDTIGPHPAFLWGRWDGGRDRKDSAYGWKLWQSGGSFGPWLENGLEAAKLPNNYSVTSVELAGAEKLIEQIAQLLDESPNRVRRTSQEDETRAAKRRATGSRSSFGIYSGDLPEVVGCHLRV